jgi:GDPmannose 4,6-dehydratase
MPESTVDMDGIGTLRILEAIKNSKLPIKFYMAASSEMFGSNLPPQNENTPFHPRSPYACAKVLSFDLTRLYREAYGIFACNGILFNHEGCRRGPTFVTRKITMAVAKIKAGLEKKIYLGNVDAKRDWGFTPEYVEVMWQILQLDQPDDFVIATGKSHSVKNFLEVAFQYAGLGDFKQYVEIDPKYFRPAEVENLVGDSLKAKNKLNWEAKIKFDELVKIMIDSDFRRLDLTPPGEGDRIIKEKFPDKWWKVD